MMKRFYLLSCLFIFLSSSLFACTFAVSSFCHNVNEFHPDLTILSGRITAQIDHGVTFEVFDVLRGSENRSTITIWDDSPFNCNGPFPREAIQLGEVGESIIVAIPLIDSTQNSWEVINDYRAPFHLMNTSSLRIENDRVKGLIANHYHGHEEAVVDMAYDDFVEEVIEQSNCAFTVDVRSPYLNESWAVFPNPAQDEVWVQLPANYASVRYQIYASNGQLMQEGLLHNSKIELAGLSQGLYMLKVESERGVFRPRKLLIQ